MNDVSRSFRGNSNAARDIAHHLHPYTNFKKHEEQGPLTIVRGRGIYVMDDDGKEYLYWNESDKILVASSLVQPEKTDSIFFEVPKEPGIYPYVCTYPGHWRRMYGALYVVADLDAYQANPEAYLAKNPMPAADALLSWAIGALDDAARLDARLGEVAQVLRDAQAQDFLDHQFASAVGVGRAGGGGFSDRHHFLVAIDGGR